MIELISGCVDTGYQGCQYGTIIECKWQVSLAYMTDALAHGRVHLDRGWGR
jgi:hypothetical protein